MNSGIFKIEMVLPVTHSANTPFVFFCGQKNSFLGDNPCIRVPHDPREPSSRRALPHYRRVRTCYVYMINMSAKILGMMIPTSFSSLAHSPWPKNCYGENIIMQCVTPAFTIAGVYTKQIRTPLSISISSSPLLWHPMRRVRYIPSASYRHAAPCAPWPWVDLDDST